MAGKRAEWIEDEAESLIETVASDLKIAGPLHYRDAEIRVLRERVAHLVEAFSCAAAAETPESFAAFVHGLAEDRFAEGYALPALQRVLGVLEERLWDLAVARSNLASLVPRLGFVNLAFASARDELARVALGRKEEAERTVVRLEREIQELFKGTDSYVGVEESGRDR